MLAYSSKDSIEIYDTIECKVVKTFNDFIGEIFTFNDKSNILAISDSLNIRFLDLLSFEQLADDFQYPGIITAIAFNQEGNILAIGNSLGSIQIINPLTHDLINHLIFDYSITKLAFNDNLLACGFNGGDIAVINLQTEIVKNISTFLLNIDDLEFCKIGIIVSAKNNSKVYIYNPINGFLVTDTNCNTDFIKYLETTNSVLMHEVNWLVFWNLTNLSKKLIRSKPLNQLALNPDQTVLACVFTNSIELYDTRTWTKLDSIEIDDRIVSNLVFFEKSISDPILK